MAVSFGPCFPFLFHLLHPIYLRCKNVERDASSDNSNGSKLGRFSISKGKSGRNGSKIDRYKVIEMWEGGNRSNRLWIKWLNIRLGKLSRHDKRSRRVRRERLTIKVVIRCCKACCLLLLQCDEIEYGKLIWSVVGNVYSQRWLPPQSLILTNGSRLN